MSLDVISQFAMQFIDSANEIMNKFMYLLVLLLMTISLFLGNFFIDK